MDITSLYTNIPQEVGIYKNGLPIPTKFLR